MDMSHKSLNTGDRIAFLRIDEKTREALVDFGPVLARNIDAVLEGFYAHIMKVPELAEMFVSEERVAHAKEAQATHWKRLFSGKFGPDYFESIQRIGRVHNRLGLEPRWYIGGYATAMTALHRLAIKHCLKGWGTSRATEKAASLIEAIDKAVMLDISLRSLSIWKSRQTISAIGWNRSPTSSSNRLPEFRTIFWNPRASSPTDRAR